VTKKTDDLSSVFNKVVRIGSGRTVIYVLGTKITPYIIPLLLLPANEENLSKSERERVKILYHYRGPPVLVATRATNTETLLAVTARLANTCHSRSSFYNLLRTPKLCSTL